jgi:arylsulfatase A-like enzyme
VHWFDETCGQLLNHLDEKGLSDNTIVVYVTDNGWIQNVDKPSFAPKSKRSPYDGGLRTPIMIRWPKTIAPQMSDEFAMSIDIAPTLYTALGLPVPKGLPGLNLLDAAARSQRTGLHGACFTHNAVDLNDPTKNVENHWIIEGQWKLIVPGVNPTAPLSAELFDLKADPHEQHNRIADHPEIEKALRAKMLAAWNATLPSQKP